MEETILVPKRLILELCQMAMPFNKKHVMAIARAITDGKPEQLLSTREQCPTAEDKKHNFLPQGCQDEHVGWNKKILVSRVRMSCVNCGYVYDLISQPFTSDDGVALRDYVV